MKESNEQILKDPRVRSVEWKDLTLLSSAEIMKELLLSFPWLLVSLWLASQGWFALALGPSFMFFLVGLRQVHNAYHYALGISRRGCDWVMFVLSALMLGSMHAVQINHLHHHRHCLGEADVEGASARMSAWKAIAVGPLFPIRLHVNALRKARGASFGWIVAELMVTTIVITAAIFVPSVWLRYHVAAMSVGQCLTSFFAVWTVHHDCEPGHAFCANATRPAQERCHLQHVLSRGAPPVSRGAHMSFAATGQATRPGRARIYKFAGVLNTDS